MGAQTGLNWSNYFVNVQTLKVSFLTPAEASHLITRPRPDYAGEKIFGNVVEHIIRQTNCHPFLVQVLCSHLIDLLNIEKGECVAPEQITYAVEEIITAWDAYFDDLWKQCDDAQQSCLLALQAQPEATLDQLQHASQLDDRSLHHTLRTLLKRDLIVKNENDIYSTAAPIFIKWVQYHA
jgi:hypothetical protein